METPSVGARLKFARTRRLLTQEELATRSGVQVVTISRIENGHYGPPKPSTIKKLALALGVGAEWLAFGAEGDEDFLAA